MNKKEWMDVYDQANRLVDLQFYINQMNRLYSRPEGTIRCECCRKWVVALATETACVRCWYSHYLGESLVAGGDLAVHGILEGLKEK